MAKFIKIDDYYVGAKIYGIYCFMQIETIGEFYQLENENDLIEMFNRERTITQIEHCDTLEEAFLTHEDVSELTALRIELAEKYNKL